MYHIRWSGCCLRLCGLFAPALAKRQMRLLLLDSQPMVELWRESAGRLSSVKRYSMGSSEGGITLRQVFLDARVRVRLGTVQGAAGGDALEHSQALLIPRL